MLNINLEKVLIKQNKKIIVPEELLLLQEYDKYAHLTDNQTLSRLGLNSNLKKGKDIFHSIVDKKAQTENFNQDRVFHISQIKETCMKYRLRFLQTEYYKGAIDSDLSIKVENFEIAYNLKCSQDNTMIMAPLESFKLEKKPVDPLFFYKINNEYYYLIHKWGNDLNMFRRIFALLENTVISFIISTIILTGLIVGIFTVLTAGTHLILAIIVAFVVNLIIFCSFENSDGSTLSIVSKNNWDSTYIN